MRFKLIRRCRIRSCAVGLFFLYFLLLLYPLSHLLAEEPTTIAPAPTETEEIHADHPDDPDDPDPTPPYLFETVLAIIDHDNLEGLINHLATKTNVKIMRGLSYPEHYHLIQTELVDTHQDLLILSDITTPEFYSSLFTSYPRLRIVYTPAASTSTPAPDFVNDLSTLMAAHQISAEDFSEIASMLEKLPPPSPEIEPPVESSLPIDPEMTEDIVVTETDPIESPDLTDPAMTEEIEDADPTESSDLNDPEETSLPDETEAPTETPTPRASIKTEQAKHTGFSYILKRVKERAELCQSSTVMSLSRTQSSMFKITPSYRSGNVPKIWELI